MGSSAPDEVARRTVLHAPAGRLLLAMALAACAATGLARVARIEIDERAALGGDGLRYEQIAERAWGELDLSLPANAIIQDIELGREADGKVRYEATFLVCPASIRVRPLRQSR